MCTEYLDIKGIKRFKDELIKIIESSKILDFVIKPRYVDGYSENVGVWVGSTITINTTNIGDKNAKRKTEKK